MVRDVFADFVGPDFSTQGRIAFESFLSGHAFSRRPGRGVALAARRGDVLVGVIEVVDGGHVALFFVSGPCRGKGVGKALMRMAVGRCRAENPDLTELTVNASPGSVGGYARMGFVAVAPERESDGIRFVPMVLRLTEPGSKAG
nr:GNAT family N-acetyltransferase [Desulfovibrio sp. Huiquan2017]